MTVQELINALGKYNSNREVVIAAYFEVPRSKATKGFHTYETMVLPAQDVRLVDGKVRIEYGTLADVFMPKE